MVDEDRILQSVQHFIRKEFEGERTGHDYFHVAGAVKTAKALARVENANVILVELSTWLHDVGDYKLHNGARNRKCL